MELSPEESVSFDGGQEGNQVEDATGTPRAETSLRNDEVILNDDKQKQKSKSRQAQSPVISPDERLRDKILRNESPRSNQAEGHLVGVDAGQSLAISTPDERLRDKILRDESPRSQSNQANRDERVGAFAVPSSTVSTMPVESSGLTEAEERWLAEESASQPPPPSVDAGLVREESPAVINDIEVGSGNANASEEHLIHATLVPDSTGHDAETEIDNDPKVYEASIMNGILINLHSRKIQCGLLVLVVGIIGAAVGGVLRSQRQQDEALSAAVNQTYEEAQKEKQIAIQDVLSSCNVADPTKLGDGKCDVVGDYNSPKCNFDFGDCEILNMYPDCPLSPAESAKLGDGKCDYGLLFSLECGLDHGDCKACADSVNPIQWEQIGNGFCDGDLFSSMSEGLAAELKLSWNTEVCDFDGFDCVNFDKYPDCHSSFARTDIFGDGICDDMEQINNEMCGWDDGDCLYSIEKKRKYPNCTVLNPQFLGDGLCQIGPDVHNSEACGWDDGDCLEYNKRFPDCYEGLPCESFSAEYPDCQSDYPPAIGNGK